jgi:membrane protease YdiL (CAAX protease family)
MVGVAAFLFLELPLMMAQHPPRHPMKLPMWMVLTLMCVQSAFFVAGFVWLGVALSSKVGLRAPAFAALAKGGSVGNALVPQLLPGIVGGILAAGVPWYFISHGLILEIHSPSALAVAVLYGGITEEVMMRWGLMTLLVWVFWRLSKRADGPSRTAVWMGIVVSAVLFGVGHIPSAHILNGQVTAAMAEGLVAGGAVFGIITGYLYYRSGLEAAMICHGLSHVLAYAAYKVT